MKTPAPATSGRTDESLLLAAAGGDRRALGELAGRYEADLLGLARGVLGGGGGGREDLAMDAVQETWVRVIRFGGGFKSKSSVKTWLYRIVINQCRTLLASRSHEQARGSVADVDESGASIGHANGTVPSARAAEPVAASADDLSSLRRGVDALGDGGRELVLLCYHAGLTHEDAAAVLDIPLGTLKSRLHAALTRLRTQLAAAEDRA